MKFRPRLIILLGVLLCLCVFAYLNWDILGNQVVVQRFDKEFPISEGQIYDYLWSNFANKPEEERFATLTTEDWQDRFHQYERHLITKARWKLLDSASLKSCLAEVFKDAQTTNAGLAYLPVGAYATRQGETPVWIIVVKWETAGPIAEGEYLELVHARMFAFDAQNIKRIGFVTCM